ncbi:hypothetical protein KKZ48_09475 [Enterobacter hormaechei subsp. xiangfangensis]|uniref:hypothetical protein n=1 Tax=Enterobacter hormaechei TaxID=158836 RepID=UPI0005DB2D83|nr:hypothetical protein [Enterobacter hormaechei]KJI62232.1 hypothetical protein UO88_14945 [Enterobacter hormaechei]MBT2045170.1 hypothetical protein [Enterobacter hormaechei subsp. xiangfangensis]MBT2094920.1 hypothetical protein [Enterobacter hormaechei subsp. xiangfangensis]VAE17373.1 Uncharacterised protein [Enterobacter hormaechei]
MVKVLVYGGGYNGVVREVESASSPVRILRGDWVRDRDAHHAGGKVEAVNCDEEFSIREFEYAEGQVYLIAEHGVTIPDEEIRKRIDVMRSLKSLS